MRIERVMPSPTVAQGAESGSERADTECKDPAERIRNAWGGARRGAGRPRVYANAAERQAAYRARRRSPALPQLGDWTDGKPPQGGTPVVDTSGVRDPCAKHAHKVDEDGQ
ncbi:MAG TPA: hypothetical protein VFB34_06800 [Chloroflexota bacterium]|nr:hypothetical protein [Chloroflexota bacterium]